MATIDDLNVVSVQGAFFVRDLDLSSPLALAQGLNSACGNLFDGPPAVLPVPPAGQAGPQQAGTVPGPNVPPNVPIIVLKTRDEQQNLNVARERIDYRRFFRGGPSVALPKVWGACDVILGQIGEYLTVKQPATVWRLGFVVQFFAKLEYSANVHLAGAYLRNGVLEGAADLQINALHRTSVADIPANRWIRLKPVRNKQNPADDSAMIAEIDINTPADQPAEFSQEEIEDFFGGAYDHLRTHAVEQIILP
ncbi:MAG: hypothetical protein JW889_00155 [Verrucomicrobia bacterium]|nr:hypothetical protein [Verrucomicrobiota bacterium]